MIDYAIKKMQNPMEDQIQVDLGTDKPLHEYIMQAIQDIEVFNIFSLYPTLGREYFDRTDPDEDIYDRDFTSNKIPFIHVCNWRWNPTPITKDISCRRRETGDKPNKTIANNRIGILYFDIYYGAKDKNGNIEKHVINNKIFVPIADEKGRYLLDKTQYSKYQLVDKLLYPMGMKGYNFKSFLPISIKYSDGECTSIDGKIITGKKTTVTVFKTPESIMRCFMHISSPLRYLGVYPILQFCDHIENDTDQYDYFQPIPDQEHILIKGYKKGLEKFEYVRSILIMLMEIIAEKTPPTINELNDPQWWIYHNSYSENVVEQRGACHETHIARMLDTISAEFLPIHVCDKKTMHGFLRYIMQTEFRREDIDIYSFSNKRLRLNEIISTLVTTIVSKKLKDLFKYGGLITLRDMEKCLKFNPNIITKDFYRTQTHSVIDFANDLDYYQLLRWTKNGPNSLGRNDKHRIGFGQRQLHPDMIGVVDLLDSSKDVGQSGMVSPWSDTNIHSMDYSELDKYPSIKYKLYDFICNEFPYPSVTFNANNIVEYNNVMDKLVMNSMINLNFKIATQNEIEEGTN